MSPKNKVNQLQKVCVNEFSNFLVHVLSDEKCSHKKTMDEYLKDVSFTVLQDLLKHILNSENLDAATRFNCLTVLLKQSVKVLETGIFPYSYYVKILEVIIRRGKGLQRLNLKGLWVHDQPELLEELIFKLKNLRVLIMPHICADFVLQPIAECSQLSVLDISGECAFSAEKLCELKSLSIKVLYIGSHGKKILCEPEEESTKVLFNLIKNLPNLSKIKTYSFVGDSFRQVFEENPLFRTKLLSISDTHTTISNAEAIVKLCPDLEYLYFDSPKEGVLHTIKPLKRLSNLKLARFDYNELVSYLQYSGSHIHSLQLCNSKDVPIDVSYICSVCPDLILLDFYRVNITVNELDTYFMCLESLDVLYCNIGDITLKYLLLNGPFLKRITIGDVLRITDGDLFRICAECEFLYLEELWLSCAKFLTTTSVQLLMSHCPNLRSLGQLTGWDVSPADVEYLRGAILANNSDLELLPTNYP